MKYYENGCIGTTRGYIYVRIIALRGIILYIKLHHHAGTNILINRLESKHQSQGYGLGEEIKTPLSRETQTATREF